MNEKNDDLPFDREKQTTLGKMTHYEQPRFEISEILLRPLSDEGREIAKIVRGVVREEILDQVRIDRENLWGAVKSQEQLFQKELERTTAALATKRSLTKFSWSASTIAGLAILTTCAFAIWQLNSSNDTRIALNETYSATEAGATVISSSDFTTLMGPYEVTTNGGSLLILFDADFAGMSQAQTRVWVRLSVNGRHIRTAMQFSSRTWDLSSIVLNEVIPDLPAGTHTISIDAKTDATTSDQAGYQAGAYIPFNNPATDTSSRKLIVIEIQD